MTESSEPDLGRLELLIGRLLRVGIVTSSVCLAVGLLLTLLGTAGNTSRLALNVGLFILLATPLARVIASVVEYASERDWTFVALTLGVLLALAGSAVAAFWR